MCGTPVVESLGGGMYDRSDFYINTSGNHSPFADAVTERYEGHDQIVAALEAGDPEAARAAAASHIFGTVALIEATINAYGAREQPVAAP
jgi:DNA-binding FadR family transcriptional regulator